MVFGKPLWLFSAAEEARIREGVETGVSDRALANEMGRSRQSIATKRAAMGILRAPKSEAKVALPVADLDWDPVEVDVVTLRDYAERHKLAATSKAVNAFRRERGLPEWSVNLRRWAA